MADAYSLLHIGGLCLRFPLASGGFAKGILL